MNIFKSILFFSLFFIVLSCDFAPGSYPNAEIYVLNYPEEDVKNAIKKFKTDNPEFKVPNVTIDMKGDIVLLDEEIGNPKPHWFKFYFYDKKNNEILYTWIRDKDKNNTKFAFISVNKGLDLKKWEIINRDFSRKENKEQLKKFEERILSKVKYYLENPSE